jgi:hypothetical protein
LLCALRLRLLPGLELLAGLLLNLCARLFLRRSLLRVLYRFPGGSMGLLRLLRTRLGFLRPRLRGLAGLRLLRLRPWLRDALLWSRLLSALLWSVLLWSRLCSPLLRLLRVLLRLFLLLFGATFVLPVNGQQCPEKQQDRGRTRCSDDFHVD